MSQNVGNGLSHKLLWAYTCGVSGIVVVILGLQLNATYTQNREIGEMRVEIRANIEAQNLRIARLERLLEER